MKENYMEKLSPVIDKILKKKYRTINIGMIGDKLTVMIFTECGWRIFAHSDTWIVSNQIEEFLKGNTIYDLTHDLYNNAWGILLSNWRKIKYARN